MSNNTINFSKALVFSDVHLNPNDTSYINMILFFNKILEKHKDIDTILFIGDTFDFWIHDLNIFKIYYKQILEQFELLSKKVKLIFFEGNHDFYFKNFFKREFNASIYKNPTIICDVKNNLYLISHGDNYIPYVQYKIAKKIFRILSFIAFILPYKLTLKTGLMFSNQNSNKNDLKSRINIHNLIKDVAYKIALKKQVNSIILGHSHIPDISYLNNNILFINPGSFKEKLTYIILDKGTPTLLLNK